MCALPSSIYKPTENEGVVIIAGAAEPGRQCRNAYPIFNGSYQAMFLVRRKQSGCSCFPGLLLDIHSIYSNRTVSDTLIEQSVTIYSIFSSYNK